MARRPATARNPMPRKPARKRRAAPLRDPRQSTAHIAAKEILTQVRGPFEPVVETDAELSLDQAKELLQILKLQVDKARGMFFRLASVRAADIVKFEGKTWDEGAGYINAEMQSLDNELARLAPRPAAEPTT